MRCCPPGQAERVLCAMQGGICVELSDPLTEDCVLEPLTYQDEEGRRVYERSLRFLFLLSLKRLYPEKRARMLNSVGYGLYLRLLNGEIGHEMARAIEEDMRELVRQDLPFQKEEWTREEAIAYFENEGWLDKAQLRATARSRASACTASVRCANIFTEPCCPPRV